MFFVLHGCWVVFGLCVCVSGVFVVVWLCMYVCMYVCYVCMFVCLLVFVFIVIVLLSVWFLGCSLLGFLCGWCVLLSVVGLSLVVRFWLRLVSTFVFLVFL